MIMNLELQIRGSIEDKLKIIFLISQWKHVVTPHKNRLEETVLMMGHKIWGFFMKKYGQFSLNYPCYSLFGPLHDVHWPPWSQMHFTALQKKPKKLCPWRKDVPTWCMLFWYIAIPLPFYVIVDFIKIELRWFYVVFFFLPSNPVWWNSPFDEDVCVSHILAQAWISVKDRKGSQR